MLCAEVPANILLEKFGEKFLDFCQDSGYDRILQGNFYFDFLTNLNKKFELSWSRLRLLVDVSTGSDAPWFPSGK